MVRGGIVQQNDERTSEVPQQLAEKAAYFFLADVVEVKQIVEAHVLALRADRNSGDDRDFVAASLPMTLQGVQPRRCQSLDHQGSQ